MKIYLVIEYDELCVDVVAAYASEEEAKESAKTWEMQARHGEEYSVWERELIGYDN